MRIVPGQLVFFGNQLFQQTANAIAPPSNGILEFVFNIHRSVGHTANVNRSVDTDLNIHRTVDK